MTDVVNAQITDAATGAVDPQITDAVSPRITGAARSASAVPSSHGDPAAAFATLYQAIAQSTAIMYENAVSAQAQMNATLQAATAAGVVQLYTTGTLTSTPADTPVSAAGVKEMIERLNGAKESLAAASSEARTAAAPLAGAEVPVPPGGDPAHPIHHLVAEGAAAIQALNDASTRQAIRQLEVAAVAATLARTLAVDPSAPNAAEQVRVCNELLREIIAVMNGWADSL